MSNGVEQISWIDAGGTEWTLNGEQYLKLLRGRQGLYAPPVGPIEVAYPQQPVAAYTRDLQWQPREVALTLAVFGTSVAQLRTNIRATIHTFDPSRGVGYLRVYNADNSVRQWACRVWKGLEGLEDVNNPGLGLQVFSPVFRGGDGMWTDQNATVVSNLPTGVSTFTTAGDQPCWPVWTITGPLTSITVQNQTTGQSWTWSGTLNAGETLTVDCTFGAKRLVKQDGSNQWSGLQVAGGSVLWYLVGGAQSLNIGWNGGTSATTIAVSYRNRYTTP